MSDGTIGATDNPTIDRLLTAQHTIRDNLRGAHWFFRRLFATTPTQAWTWTGTWLVIGICTPLEIWAAGNTIADISTEVTSGSEAHPWRWTAVFVGLLILERVLEPIATWAETLVRQRGVTAIHAEMLNHTTAIDLAALEYQAFYDTTRRTAEELPGTTRLLVGNMGQVLRSGPSVAGTAIILATVDWRFVAALLIPLVPNIFSFLKVGIDLWHVLSDQTRDRRIAAYIATQMTSRPAAKEIRLYQLKPILLERFSFHYLNTRDQLRKQQFWLTLRLQLTAGVGGLASLAAFIWIALRLNEGLSASDVTILMTSVMAFRPYDLQMAAMAVGKQGALAADIRRFLALPAHWAPRGMDNPDSTPQAFGIRAENLTYAYPGTTTPVVDGISVTIPAGQRVAIVGENGAGKTTLLKLLLGLYEPDSGSVRIGDRDVRHIPVPELQRATAAVFQQFARYPVSWEQNITLGASGDPDRLAAVTAMSGSVGTLRALAHGVDTVLSPDLGGVDLSGGQWQRLAIARAGFRDAAILVLDEPTAALDPLAEVDIFRRFTELSQGRTTLLVSHRLGMCRLADRILVLENGTMIEDGTHDELIARQGRYAGLWEMQARWYR